MSAVILAKVEDPDGGVVALVSHHNGVIGLVGIQNGKMADWAVVPSTTEEIEEFGRALIAVANGLRVIEGGQ